MDTITKPSPLVLTAIHKAAGKPPKIEPGDHIIDFSASFKGHLRKGDDYEAKMVAKADPWALLAVALSKLNGVTIDSLIKQTENMTVEPNKIKKSANDAIAKLKEPTLTVCSGKTTGQVFIELI